MRESGFTKVLCYHDTVHIVILNDDALGPGSRGGVAVVSDILRRNLAKAGHRVTYIGTHQKGGGAVERASDAFGDIITMPVLAPAYGRHRRVASVTPASTMLDAILRELKPDIVHAHNIHNALTYDALRIARRYTDRVFLTTHDTFLVSFTRVAGPRYENALKKGLGYRMHWWEHLQAVGRQYWPLRNTTIKRILRSSVKNVIVYTRAMESFLRANGITNIAFVHSGIEPIDPIAQDRVDAFKKAHDLASPCVLYGARISGDKGIGALLAIIPAILKEFPQCTFLIIGDRERLEPYLKNVTSNVRRALRTPGWIAYDELQTAYAACDVVTVPSLYLDNFPTINLEAMRAGKPVVGTCFGGTPEAVKDGETGFIVDPRNTDAYAECVLRLLRNPKLAQRMGIAGRKCIENDFSIERHIQDHLALYAS